MLCEHLAPLERELIAARVKETFRGQAWSDNCREWVYFACWLDRGAIRARMTLDPCVQDHVHDGQEEGLFARLVMMRSLGRTSLGRGVGPFSLINKYKSLAKAQRRKEIRKE
jgi:hypothetical protein